MIEINLSEGELLVVPIFSNDKFSYCQVFTSRKLGNLSTGDNIIYLGETKLSKRTKRTMIKVLTRFGVGWIDPRPLEDTK